MEYKKNFLIGLLVSLSAFLVSCTTGTGSLFNDIIGTVIGIGRLEFLGMGGESIISGFMRVAILIIVFALLYEVIGFTGISRNVRIAISGVLSVISAVFMPGSILVAIGGAYATAVAFVLLGALVFGGGYALYRIPATGAGARVLRLVIIVVLIWILIMVKSHAASLLSSGVITGIPGVTT